MGKLNEVLRIWPSGTVVVQSWLEQHCQISRQLTRKYVKGGWVEKIGPGAYVRSGDKVDWRGGVYALQQLLKLPIHVGGKTALELSGRAHFVPMGSHRLLYLYTHGDHPERQLPRWLTQYFNNQSFNYISNVLFTGAHGLQAWNCSTFGIWISNTERALLEILALVPKKMSFEHAFLLMQGKETLRVDVLQGLLEDCRSQVLKRLFLYLAKKCQLPCFERLNLKTLKLGQGKRTIDNGDHYDPQFKLFVPNLSIDKQEGDLYDVL